MNECSGVMETDLSVITGAQECKYSSSSDLYTETVCVLFRLKKKGNREKKKLRRPKILVLARGGRKGRRE